MNRAERIYRLHAELKSNRPLSLQALMDRLEVSRATLVRDIGYMRDFMGAPIIYDRSANGYRYATAESDFELPGLWFNESELYALLAMEQLLESVQPGFLGPWIGPLKNRIRKLLEHGGHRSETVSARIRIQPMAWRPLRQELFGATASAVLEGRRLDIEYHGRQRGEITQRRVHPCQLLHYRDNWYLISWCERAKDYRTFSLDRIRQARVTEKAVRKIDEKQLQRHVSASFGIFSGEARHWAVLRFSAERAQWVADETWHPDQIGQWKGDAYELQIPYSDERELLMDILKYGPDVEVLAPPQLRRKVGDSLEQALRRYRKK